MDRHNSRIGFYVSVVLCLIGMGLGIYHAVTDIPAGCRGGSLSTCGDGRTTGIVLILITGTLLVLARRRWRELNKKDSFGKDGE